ncbi:MAG: hypothetical protein HAW63_00520 [Bdellovibrionaceae bacterium]|nr:hypothetical protein [Pseudobdellovibrionaceae bacterium]
MIVKNSIFQSFCLIVVGLLTISVTAQAAQKKLAKVKLSGFVQKKAKKAQSVFAQQQPHFFQSSHFSSQWGLSTWRWKEGLNDSLGVLLSVKVNWEKELISNLLFKTSIDFKASKSRLQQHIFGSKESGVYAIRQAKLVALPFSSLSVDVGILSEGFWNKDLLISSSSSFIGSRQSWNTDTKNLSFAFHLEQSIPPSTSNDNYRLANEKLPYFLMAQGEVNYQKTQWSLKSQLFYANYLQLPNVVAFQSSLLGNTVVGDQPSNSNFLWGFGILGAGLNYYYPLWNTGLESYILLNHKADSSVAKARFLKLYFDNISLFSQDLTLVLEEFFVEPDATVSYYNSGTYGHTNREGFSVAVLWNINQFSKLGLRYLQSNVINLENIQDTLQSVSVSLESKL